MTGWGAADVAVLRDVETAWHWGVAAGDSAILGVDWPGGQPEHIRAALARMAQWRPVGFSGGSVLDELDHALDGLSDEDTEVVKHGLLAEKRTTNRQLGDLIGMTAKQAGSRRTAVRAHMRAAFRPGSELDGLVRAVVDEAAPVDSLARIERRFPDLVGTVPRLGYSLAWVIARLSSRFEISDGWVAAPNIQTAKAITVVSLEEAVGRENAVALTAKSTGVRLESDERRAWVQHCGLRVRGNMFERRAPDPAEHSTAPSRQLPESRPDSRSSPAPGPPPRDPRESRSVYALSEGLVWVMEVPVGSAVPVPPPAFVHRVWLAPAPSEIAALVADCGAEPGSLVAVMCAATGELSCRPIVDPGPGAPLVDRVLARIGHPAPNTVPLYRGRTILAGAIGLRNADEQTVLDALRARGEVDLLALLEGSTGGGA